MFFRQILGLAWSWKLPDLLSDLPKEELRVPIENLCPLRRLLRLPVMLSFIKILDMNTKTPELVFRKTKRYCCGLPEVFAGKKPRMKPRPSRKESIRVFLKAAKTFSDCPTFLKSDVIINKIDYTKVLPETSRLVSSGHCSCCDCNIEGDHNANISQEDPHVVLMEPADRSVAVLVESDIHIKREYFRSCKEGQDKTEGSTIPNEVNGRVDSACFEHPCDRVVQEISFNSWKERNKM